MKRSNKTWSKEEIEYLIDKYGTVSIKSIAQRLGRSENAVIVKKNKLQLGAFLEAGDYITWNAFLSAIGSGNGGYKVTSWIQNRGFPVHFKRVNNNSFRIVYIDEFWEWAEKNKDILDFSTFEENMLGEEPEWAKLKRRYDVEKKQKYIASPWTHAEDERLAFLLSKNKYSCQELSSMLRRTEGAIIRRISTLGLKDRPLKNDNTIKWLPEELDLMGELIKQGYDYEKIAEAVGKSSKACRGKVYTMYLTENLDKVRQIMGTGVFGDNRPERKVKQFNVMNAEERIEVKENCFKLVSILQYRFMEQVNKTGWKEFFQKDMCENFGSGWLTRSLENTITWFKEKPYKCKDFEEDEEYSFWNSDDNFRDFEIGENKFMEKINNCFSFIQWSDIEPYSIEELLTHPVDGNKNDDSTTCDLESVLRIINDVGGCHAVDEYSKGWDDAVDHVYEAVKKAGAK